MSVKEDSCKYKGKVKLGDDELDWCFYYSAKIGDVNCETCAQDIRMKNMSIV